MKTVDQIPPVLLAASLSALKIQFPDYIVVMVVADANDAIAASSVDVKLTKQVINGLTEKLDAVIGSTPPCH